jgi:P4 family phage/plasmid primase-like protien
MKLFIYFFLKTFRLKVDIKISFIILNIKILFIKKNKTKMELQDFKEFKEFRYFGINVIAYSDKDGNIKKNVIAPLETKYKNTIHYYKPIYNKVTNIEDIIPNGIAIITKQLSTIDVDDVNNCSILDQLLNDCSFIIKTRKGYHFYFNKENVLERNKKCGVADINLNTLYFVPKYYHNVSREEYQYSIFKNSGPLVDMPNYALEWCLRLIKDRYGEKKDKKDKITKNDKDEDTDTKENDNILYQLLDGLKIERFSNYGDWFAIACVFVNEGFDLKIFDKYSQKGKGYNKEVNTKIINSLKKDSNGYRIATLYYMLKNDNQVIWTKLQSQRKDFWTFMETFNHFDIALIYYQLYPSKYIYSNNTWYSLNSNNVYLRLNDCKDVLFNNITMTIQQIIIEQRNLVNPNDEYYLAKNKLVKLNYNNIGNSNFKKGVIEALCGLYYVNNIESKLNENINLIAFDDKVFDVTIGEYRSIKPSDYISMTVGYNAPTQDEINKHRKNIDDLLWSIFEEKDVIDYWLKTIGLGFFGNKSESLYIHTGSGRNGKGVLGTMIEKCLGLYYQTADSNLLTGETKSVTNSTLANAKYTRMLVLSEPEDTDEKNYKLKTALVKSITGGDTITVRDLYKSNISYKPKFNIILQCNKKPDIDRLDIAIEQRLKVIHYPFTFVENPSNEYERKIDTTLKDKFSNNKCFIKSFMGILLEYAHKNYNCNTISLPVKVTEQNNLYFDENNPVKDFLNDCCEITNNNNDKIGCRDLYLQYTHCNFYKNIDEKKFSDLMCNLNKIEKKRMKNGFFYLKIKFLGEKND